METPALAIEDYVHHTERSAAQRHNAVSGGALRLMRALVHETRLSQAAIPAAAALVVELDRPIKDRAKNP